MLKMENAVQILCLEVSWAFHQTGVNINSYHTNANGFMKALLQHSNTVAMKSFERLGLAYLKDITGPLLDPLQFAYRANRSVNDAVNIGLHYLLQHLDRPWTYVRILFVDFSSAFNTIIPSLLQPKLTQHSVPTSVCQWITSFLTDRQQLVRLGKFSSSTHTISTGAPQGCVLSPYSSLCTPMTASLKTPLSSS